MVGEGSVRILVVSGGPKDAQFSAETLARLPYHSVVIETAASGAEGLAKTRRALYDLVFLDYALPGGEGPRVLRALRDENSAQVVVLSGHADIRSAVEALRLGALDYIVKEDVPARDWGRLIEHCLGLVRLKRANCELEKLNAMKNDFIDLVSQELLGPMAAIAKTASALLSGTLGPLTKQQRDSLDQLLEQDKKLARLRDDFAELRARVSGPRPLEGQEPSLASLVKESLARAQDPASAKGLRVALLPPAEAFPINANAGDVSTVLNHVVKNAVRFTPMNGSVSVQIQRLNAGEVEIVVQDTGEGIEPDRLQSLLDSAAEPGRTDLAFCRQALEANRGRMRIASPGKGKGTQVSLVFSCPEPAGKAPCAGARKVLLVDDNRDVLELLKFLLRRGMDGTLELLTATTGEQALSLCSQSRPSLIILDVMLSGMDGLEVLEALRKAPPTQAVPVLIMSAFPETTDRALELGASAVLLKPFPPEKLLREVRTLIQDAEAGVPT